MNNKEFTDRYPFLKEIPSEILDTMDLNGLDFPTENQAFEIRKLERELRSFIVIYQRGYEPLGTHLCKTIRSTNLDLHGQTLIKEFELNFLNPKAQIAVAYENPVRFF